MFLSTERSLVAAIERAVGRPIAHRTIDGFNYNAKPEGRLEIPIRERIAAHRARRADERARTNGKTRRRTQPGGRRQPQRNARAAN